MGQFNIRNLSSYYENILEQLSNRYGSKTAVVYAALDCLVAQNNITQVLGLAACLPSGLPDHNAADKLIKERDEFRQALEAGDTIGALTELADRIYCACKEIHAAAYESELTINQAFSVCIAKYSLRAHPGNPKDDITERIACINSINNQ